MRVHLGMMVKDREASVRRALESARPFVDGYTILDTGSTDGTRAICAEFGRVHDVPWSGDYGDMRTKVMAACRADGADAYLMLDSDEEITSAGDYADMRSRMDAEGLDAVMVDCVPIMLCGRQPSEPNFRLIRLDRGMHWHYAYDEQLHGWRPDKIGFSTLSIDQDYKRDFAVAHAARHAYLAPMRERADYGSGDWCHATYFLMRSFDSIGHSETAEQYAAELTLAKPTSVGLASAWTFAARAALLRGDLDRAWRRIAEGLYNHPGYADLWHLAALVALGRMSATAADRGPYFATAQVSPLLAEKVPEAMRALGATVGEEALA